MNKKLSTFLGMLLIAAILTMMGAGMWVVLTQDSRHNAEYSERFSSLLTEVKDGLLDISYEDLDYYDDGSSMYGEANVIVSDEYSYSVFYCEDDVIVMVTFDIYETRLGNLVIDGLEIIYQDTVNEVYVDVYIYDELLFGNYRTMELQYSVAELNDIFLGMNTYCYQYGLEVLGYNVSNDIVIE